MPMADIVVDLHSGGASLDYLPTSFTNLSGQHDIDSAAIAAMRAFGAPMCMIFKDDGDTRRAFSSAHQNECVYLSTELGGTGSVNVDNLLLLLCGHRSGPQALRASDRRYRAAADPQCRAHPLRAGAGSLLPAACHRRRHIRTVLQTRRRGAGGGARGAHLQSGARPTSRARAFPDFKADGFVICRRYPALVQAGDCIAHTAIDFDASPW